jgi:hypothetical protein
MWIKIRAYMFSYTSSRIAILEHWNSWSIHVAKCRYACTPFIYVLIAYIEHV